MEGLSISEQVSRENVEAVLAALVRSDPEAFLLLFRRLRRAYPREALRMAVRYLGDNQETTALCSEIIGWLKLKNYFEPLLDPDFLAIDEARRVAERLRVEDSANFFLHFSRLTAETDSREKWPSVRRALAILEGLSEHAVLFSWLRGLSTYPDEQVRSKAVKAFCRLKSSTVVVQTQLASSDARVRANAVEALWRSRTPEAEKILRTAALDPHHRVVMNVLVGLHFHGDETAWAKLLEYSQHPSEAFRLAVVWALGYVSEPNGLPVLKHMAQQDSSQNVRDKAARTLESLKPSLPVAAQVAA